MLNKRFCTLESFFKYFHIFISGLRTYSCKQIEKIENSSAIKYELILIKQCFLPINLML